MPAISPVGWDVTLRHAALLEQLKAGQAKDLLPFLREIDQDIRIRLSKGELTRFSRARLERLLGAVDENIDGVLRRFASINRKQLRALAANEAQFEGKSLAESIGSKVFDPTVPAPSKVWASVQAAPLSVRGIHGGELLPAFMKGWNNSTRELVVNRIRRGAFEGETNASIARAIRGTEAGRFGDGTLAQVNRRSQAFVRTAVQHVSHTARMSVFEANQDLVKAYRWVSTLDNKTSEICQALSGEEFPVGDGPVPPAHVNCRSTIVAVLDERFNFLKEGRTQQSQFGPVDQNQTYFSWIKKQPKAFQDQVLGKVKGKLLRDGGLTPQEFQKLTRSANFRPLTLAEMQKLQPLAFEKAGIRVSAGGRAIIKTTPKPSSKTTQGIPKPNVVQSLDGPGVAPKRTAEMEKWRKAKTFSRSPRLAPLSEAVDDPGHLAPFQSGAFYQPANQSIHMGKKSDVTSARARSTMRHEWGHYLDDLLRRYANDENHYLYQSLNKLAGRPVDLLTSRFISGWSKPVAALKASNKRLMGYGKRVDKLANPSSRKRTFNQSWISHQYQARVSALQAAGEVAELVGPARASLETSDHVVAKLWRELKKKKVATSMVDDVVWAEAAAADDLSILFMNQGRSMSYVMGEESFAALSDLLGAVTREQIGGYGMGWGHGKTYYKRGGMHSQATEAFANLTSLEEIRASNSLIDELVRSLVPELDEWYDELINSLVRARG